MHADAEAFALTEHEGFADADARDAAHDPRMDPQPGDVLGVDKDVREVIDRVGDRVEYGFPRRAATRWLTLIRWQVWARHAEVLAQAYA